MKKLEPKKKEETPVNEPANPEPPKPEPFKTKEKPDYTWVWILVGLLSTMAVVYFMNINKPKENGNPEPQK